MDDSKKTKKSADADNSTGKGERKEEGTDAGNKSTKSAEGSTGTGKGAPEKRSPKDGDEPKPSPKGSDENDTQDDDVDKLRLSQDFRSSIGVKKEILTIPVRKPDRQWFVQTHPSDDYRFPTAILEIRDDRETYLVAPALREELAAEVIPVELVATMNRQGDPFLWPIRLPREDGRVNEWNRSSAEAAEKARGNWIRVGTNQSIGSYEVFCATGDLPPPVWPEITMKQMIRTAFRDRILDDATHPVVRRLRGEI